MSVEVDPIRRSESRYKRAIEKDSQNAEYYRLLSEIERGDGNLVAAEQAVRQAAVYDPSNVAICLERGMIAYDEGDFGQAISCYNEAVVAAPDEPYSYLARAYTQEYGMEIV